MILYCVCGEPVMDPMYDAGCRRCGRPVDFSPRGPAPAPFACTPDESAGLREEAERLFGSEEMLRETQYAEELAAGRDPRD